MLITKVTRTYSRSINSRNYGAPESWVKVEATYEAVCETSDNPIEVSKMVYEQAKKDVVEACDEIIKKMKANNQNLQNTMSSGTGGVAPAPGTVTAPRSL